MPGSCSSMIVGTVLCPYKLPISCGSALPPKLVEDSAERIVRPMCGVLKDYSVPPTLTTRSYTGPKLVVNRGITQVTPCCPSRSCRRARGECYSLPSDMSPHSTALTSAVTCTCPGWFYWCHSHPDTSDPSTAKRHRLIVKNHRPRLRKINNKF